MKNSKLVKVISTFSRKEFKEFGRFVNSSYVSSGRNVKPLYEIFKSFYGRFDQKEFTKENILSELSQKGYKASYNLLKIQMTEMYKLAEQFLISQSAKNETGLNTFFFARECAKRGLYNLIEPKISRSMKLIEKKGIDAAFYRNYYFGNVELINYFFNVDKPLRGVNTLNHLSEILVHNFLCTVSRYYFNQAALKSGLNVQSPGNLLHGMLDTLDLEKLLSYLEKKEDVYSKASVIYILFMMMLKEADNDAHFFRFKEKLFTNIDLFSSFEKVLFLNSLNYRAEGLMNGIKYMQFAEEAFDIFNFRLRTNNYKQNPRLKYTSGEFHTALYIGFVLRKKEWIGNFIDRYLKEVSPEQRNETAARAGAFIEFLDHEYGKCLSSINLLKDISMPAGYDIKRLQLMAIFDSGNVVQAFEAAAAFKAYLKKNRNVSGLFFQRNITFIDLYVTLLRHKFEGKTVSLKKLRVQALNSDTLNQEWIIEKIDEM
jgi:hypothetical protein